MSDSIGMQALVSRLRPDDRGRWAIIKLLADLPESDRRRILRPHAEAGFAAERDAHLIEQRSQLDVALGTLTLLEIGSQVGVVTAHEHLVPEISSLRKLFRESEALLRYANAYLFFGVRFLAGRIAPPEWMTSTEFAEPLIRRSNERPFAFVIPPALSPSPRTEANFAALVNRPQSSETSEAMLFLDDFIRNSKEPGQFELWLRGLRPETDEVTRSRFSRLSRGLAEWAMNVSNFYLSLEAPSTAMEPPTESDGAYNEGEGDPRPLGGWMVTDPAAARLGLRDMYWIARLLRADVSAEASVTYTKPNWLHLLRFQAGLAGNTALETALEKAEEVLRSVFDFVCDLVQNANELSAEKEQRAYQPELFTTPPPRTAKWREVFDEELDEIDLERNRRRYRDASLPDDDAPASPSARGAQNRGDGWMERLKTGKQPHNLIGVALSGGGIRSATFNLGVLQGLQEFDLLRYVDFLSSVSGGGFIGSWLVANVCRTSHWLGRFTSWKESIAHLRRYSNYLSPRTGVLSADTWTMWASWARNAMLIQITGLAWLLALLLTALVAQSVFYSAGAMPIAVFGLAPYSGALAGLLMVVLLCTLLYNLTGSRAVTGDGNAFRSDWVRRSAVVPSWISAFLVASLLWADATGRSALSPAFRGCRTYSSILMVAWYPWRVLLSMVLIALGAIAAATLYRRRWHALWISPACVLALYLELCGIMRLFVQWGGEQYHFSWYAFVFGPGLVLAANTFSVVLFIGFCGRNSTEPIREWWTRFGTWLAIYGAGSLAIAISAVFGPLWILLLVNSRSHWTIKWGAVAGWVGTVIAGLIAGNSSKTVGNGARSSSPVLEILAKAGGILFIAGAMLGTATILYVLLVNIGTDADLTPYWNTLRQIPLWLMAAGLGITVACGSLFSWFFEINIFGLNQFYRNRLVRCYLGATRWAPGLRKPQPFTNFDGKDDMRLSAVVKNYRGPFPIFNCALNLGGSADLALHTRHSASFSLTPLRCGADRPRVGYAPTAAGDSNFAGGVMLGQAVAISGAAASPNMGYNTSPLVSFLLTMFNVRLGWWFPNPGQRAWDGSGLRFSLYYLVKELFGLADERKLFVNVSDGGHFENLGIYELVRRRCKVIIAADAECDEFLQFGSLGNLVRVCETDFGAKIDIDVASIRQQKDGFSLAHCTVGRITYSNGSIGYLIYLKASVSGDEDVSITQYRSIHPSFPHETTADQFFSEDQFESYRQLGLHVVRHSLRGNQPGDHPVSIAEKLADVLAPGGNTAEVFLKHTKALDGIWERFRLSPSLRGFMDELRGAVVPMPLVGPPPQNDEVCLGLELIQLMENVFIDLRLDDFWEHPDNRGWAILFMRWARSPRFRAIWKETHRTFGIRFEYFCAARLGLPRDQPIVRV